MKIIIVGKTASGKDYFLNEFRKLGYKIGTKYTTRPIRTNEIPGQTYYYSDNNSFIKMESNNLFFCRQRFHVNNDIWYYGLTNYEWENNEVFILTPNEIDQVYHKLPSNTIIVYLDIPERILKERLYKRSDNSDSIDRRLKSDRNDFYGFLNYDYRIVKQIDINTLKNIINI